MGKGELRKSIMDNCPEEFEDELKDFIDNIETRLASIVSLLNITDIAHLDRIEDAFKEADDLVDSLY